MNWRKIECDFSSRQRLVNRRNRILFALTIRILRWQPAPRFGLSRDWGEIILLPGPLFRVPCQPVIALPIGSLNVFVTGSIDTFWRCAIDINIRLLWRCILTPKNRKIIKQLCFLIKIGCGGLTALIVACHDERSETICLICASY